MAPRIWRRAPALPFAIVLALLTACSGGGGGDTPSPNGSSNDNKPPSTIATITSPKDGATGVPAAAEIAFTTERAKSADVKLATSDGNEVTGALLPDGKTWRPGGQLEYGAKYIATVTATADDGTTGTAKSTFTVMDKPANQVRVSSVVGDEMVVGVGMPMIVQFGRAIPESVRDTVESRMVVTSDPPQEGALRWYNDSEVHYRPKAYWKSGTKLDMRIQLGGLPLGDGWYGRADLSVLASVGPSMVMTVNNATKKMTVTQNGKVTRTIPVSLGRPSMPSSSGTMLVMERFAKTVFDTTNDPNPANRYRVDIQYAERLTWGGEFIHAAPWSVADQGHRNVSHGCINMSTDNAKWIYENSHLGDPVTVQGTETKLQWGNGWTDWLMSWEEYSKG